MKQNLSSFQRNRDTLADADAHGRQRPPATRQAELKRRRACYARAGALSQILQVNSMLTMGREVAAPDIAERADDFEYHCRKAEAPVEG